MDSMDWFDPKGDEALTQIHALNRALKPGGRVMLRSAGLTPWYIPVFERCGFIARRVGARFPGTCIDRYDPSFIVSCTCLSLRVNMYASTWIMTKATELVPPVFQRSPSITTPPLAKLEI